MGAEPEAHTGRFSLVVGGPFHALLTRFGLNKADCLPSQQAAIGIALLAWLTPALLAVAQALVDSRYSAWGYFTDASTYTRYLIAIWAMIATERYADSRTIMLIRQFREARIVSSDGLPGYASALDIADRRSASWLAELLILAVAVVWSSIAARITIEHTGSSWLGTAAAGETALSWAGGAASFLSNPLFLFLVLRWIWRFLVWAALLTRISRLPLQLAPMHPDRSAGLGFLAIYPSVFSGFVFALSCVVSSAFLQELAVAQHAPETIWLAIAVWLAIILILFLGPLLVFVPPLYAMRERALLDYGRLANQHHLAFHRKWIGEARDGEALMGSPDPSSASDLNASVQAVRDLRLIPVDLPAVVQLLLSAGIPLLAVVSKEIPLADIVKWLVGTIL